jgi:hypothetical protein
MLPIMPDFWKKPVPNLASLSSFGKLAMALAAMPPRLLILKRRLRLKDLGSAIKAVGQWSGSDLPSLNAWLAAAKARQALDKAVNGLVTDYLAIAIDVQ